MNEIVFCECHRMSCEIGSCPGALIHGDGFVQCVELAWHGYKMGAALLIETLGYYAGFINGLMSRPRRRRRSLAVVLLFLLSWRFCRSRHLLWFSVCSDENRGMLHDVVVGGVFLCCFGHFSLAVIFLPVVL